MRTVKGKRIRELGCWGFMAIALGLAPGCEGGQTGDLSGQNDGSGTVTEENGGGCEERKQELSSFDELTDAGSANQLLAFAERSFDAPLTWKAARSDQSWSVGPESGQGQLHVDVARGAKAYLLSYSPKPVVSGGVTLDIAVECPPAQLGVETHVSVSTDGGALNEEYDTLLRATVPGVARFSVPFDPAKLSGTLSVSSSNPDAKLVQLALEATFTADGMSGRIAGLEQVQHGTGPNSAVSAMDAVLALWPASEACAALFQDGVGLGMSIEAEALGFSGRATLESLVPPADQPITWLDGEQTTLTVRIEPEGDGCLRVSDQPVDLGGGPSVSYPVTIELESADGRLKGAYPGKVVAMGSGAARSVSAEAALDFALKDVEQSGFAMASVPSTADSLVLRVEATLEAGVGTGIVRLIAVTDADCPSEAPTPTPGGGSSSPGCAGQTQTPVESASWSH